MSFSWDSFSDTVESWSGKVESVADTAAKAYSAVTNFKTSKLNNDAARTVADINAQTQLQRAKNDGLMGGSITPFVPSNQLEAQPGSGDSAPIVISKQGGGGFSMKHGLILLLALFVAKKAKVI